MKHKSFFQTTYLYNYLHMLTFLPVSLLVLNLTIFQEHADVATFVWNRKYSGNSKQFPVHHSSAEIVVC